MEQREKGSQEGGKERKGNRNLKEKPNRLKEIHAESFSCEEIFQSL